MTGSEASARMEPGHDMGRWLTLVDLAPVRIWLLDARHRVRSANRAACAVPGMPLDRIRAMSQEQFGEAHAVHDMDERRAALAGRIARWAGWARYPNGVRRYTERTCLPFRAATPDGPLYFEFTVDQTALMQAREQAEAAERVRPVALCSVVAEATEMTEPETAAAGVTVERAPPEVCWQAAG